MSYQASLGVGSECYNCILNELIYLENGSSGDLYDTFCSYGDFEGFDLSAILICGGLEDCDAIEATAFVDNLASICDSSPPGSNATSTASTLAAPSTVPTTSTIISITPSATQASQSNVIPQTSLTSTTKPLSTSQAATTTTKTSSTPSTSLPTPSYISIQTKSTQTPTPTPTPTSTSTSTSTSSTSSQISTDSSASFTLSVSTHPPLSAYTGSGDLLRGYCTTPFYTLIPGPTADLYIGVVGCVNGKDDCCPFSVASTHATTATEVTTATVTTGTVTIESFVTITVASTSPTFTSASETFANIGQNQAFPTPDQPSEATLDYCPDDYQTVSSACCPSSYLLWTAMLGGQTPCYSTLSAFLTPPPLPIPTTTSTISPLPTSTIINVIYAMAYPVKSSSPALTPDAKAGVGAGTGVFAIVMIFAIAAYFLRRRGWKISGPINSTRRQSTADMVATESSNSRVSGLHHNSFPYPQPGAFDRDTNTVSVPPPLSESATGYMISHHPAREQRASQRLPVPVSTEAPAQSASSPLPPRSEMDSYHTPVNFGLPPGELFGGHVEQRQELQDSNWSS